MTSWLLLLLVLACPLMMIFMMRGMDGSGDRTESGRRQPADHQEPHSSTVEPADSRIGQLEREIASLRSAQGEQQEARPGHRS